MSEESYETTEEYKKETAKLFEYIERRDQMLGLLKIAEPSKIPEIRKVIAKLDGHIRTTEKIMEMHAKMYYLRIEAAEEDRKSLEMCDAILPELLAYLAEHNPEAGEKLKADLAEIDAREDDEDE